MAQKKEENFELFKQIKAYVTLAEERVENAISRATGEDVCISDALVKVNELQKFFSSLKDAEKAKNFKEIRKFLKEDTIPLELVVMDPFWGEFQKLIYDLISK